MYKVPGKNLFLEDVRTSINRIIVQLPNVSPETGIRDNAVPYKVLMKFRAGLDPTEKMKPCLGCNGVPSGNGGVNVGDWVYVKKMIGNTV
jgi:uncharacterized protein YcbX